MLRSFFRKSRWIHKYVGLVLIFFTTWMALSGILLNHPDWIAGLSVPRAFVPPQYRARNWNRGALKGITFSSRNSDTAFVYGSQGVWKSLDGGVSFLRMSEGFPGSFAYRKTDSLVLQEEPFERLLAGTRGGLYVCDPGAGKWSQVHLGEEREPVKRVLLTPDAIVAFTPSHVFRAAPSDVNLVFEEVTPDRLGSKGRSVSLVTLFFETHSGKIWGLPGQLLFDVVGLTMVFLSISAFYIWYFPWRLPRARKRSLSRSAEQGSYRWLLTYHLKIGIWLAVLLLIIGGTGFFMRPPMLAALVGGEISGKFYPGPLSSNPWHEKIKNAVYDPLENRILIEADGIWEGPVNFEAPYVESTLEAPVFVMGTTVFETNDQGDLLVGSFSGLFQVQRASGDVVDLLSGERAEEISTLRPAEVMAAGYVRTPRGEEFLVAHHQGVIPLDQALLRGRFGMPKEMGEEYRMPLWNFLFELHNGRIFKDLIGPFYALVAPLGSLLFVLIALTGVYDWTFLRFKGRKARKGLGA